MITAVSPEARRGYAEQLTAHAAVLVDPENTQTGRHWSGVVMAHVAALLEASAEDETG